MSPLTYTVEEAAKVLRVGRNQMYALIHTAGVPHITVGRRILVPRDGLQAWLTQTSTR